MSDWSSVAGFGAGVKLNESTFDTKVGGGKFLDVGVHKDMLISEVELKTSKAGNPYVKVRFENEEGAGMNHTVMLTSYDDKDTGESKLHWSYTDLGNAILNADLSLSLKFFGEVLPTAPQLFEGLIGLKASIKIVHGKKGFIVKDVPTGGKQLIDIETDQPFDGTEVYADYTECKEAAEELGLERCWNEVARVFAASKDAQEKNVEVVNKLVSSGAPKKKAKKPLSL
jgi:hypothetical protein